MGVCGWQLMLVELLGPEIVLIVINDRLCAVVSRRLEARHAHAQRLEAESEGGHQHGSDSHRHALGDQDGTGDRYGTGPANRRPAQLHDLAAPCCCCTRAPREQLTSVAAVAGGGQLSLISAMLGQEIIAGPFLAGFIALLGDDFFDGAVLQHARGAGRGENVPSTDRASFAAVGTRCAAAGRAVSASLVRPPSSSPT